MTRTVIPAALADRQHGQPFETNTFRSDEWKARQTTKLSAKNKQLKQMNR